MQGGSPGDDCTPQHPGQLCSQPGPVPCAGGAPGEPPVPTWTGSGTAESSPSLGMAALPTKQEQEHQELTLRISSTQLTSPEADAYKSKLKINISQIFQGLETVKNKLQSLL